MKDYRRGQRDGIRWAITWLHGRAKAMNDPNAKAILNSAAFGLGVGMGAAEVLLSEAQREGAAGDA